MFSVLYFIVLLGFPAGIPVHFLFGCTTISGRTVQCVCVQLFETVHVWWGYSRMHANATHLRIEAVTNLDGSVFDTLSLFKPPEWGQQWHQQHSPPLDGPGSHSVVRPVPRCFYPQVRVSEGVLGAPEGPEQASQLLILS